jgi:hypothetical protein
MPQPSINPDTSRHAPDAAPPASPDAARRLERLERLAHNLDSRYRLPGTRIRFGWDSILGLIPGIGDTATLAPAGYILLESYRLGVPNGTLAKMAAASGADWVLGSVPLVGDLLDVGLKANRRNVAALRRDLARRGLVAEAGEEPELISAG